MEFDPSKFGHHVRRLRKAKTWSIRRLAEMSGVAKNTVLRIEKGESSTASARERVARALGTFEDYISILEEDDQIPYELAPPEGARWRISFFSPDRKLPSDIDELIQDPRQRARLAGLGWVSRYERYTAPRRSAQYPGMHMMEIWAANGVPGSHPDVEIATVIRGAVRILLGEDRIELREGEGISFLATIPHDYEPLEALRPGDLPVLVLHVLLPLQE